jgi:hypothetical protein
MTKEIRLANNRGVVIVDDEDFEWAGNRNWCLSAGGYASRGITTKGKKETVFMHREIMNTPKGMFTDHINGNKMDNRRKNLRVCTTTENSRNQKVFSNNKSGYKGVKAEGRSWLARIRVDGKPVYLGVFISAEEAAKAYDKAARKYFGEFARPNFQEGEEN